MKVTDRWFSERLQQPITLARWGHFGTPVLVFPTAGGDAEEIERNHMVTACADLVDAGRIKLYSCDSVAGQAMVASTGSPTYRMWLLNQFHECVVNEIVPAIHADLGGQEGADRRLAAESLVGLAIHPNHVAIGEPDLIGDARGALEREVHGKARFLQRPPGARKREGVTHRSSCRGRMASPTTALRDRCLTTKGRMAHAAEKTGRRSVPR